MAEMQQKFIDSRLLRSFGADTDYAARAKALLAQQKSVWKQLADGYRSLASVRIKMFDIDGIRIKVQFNPGRITSSSAQVDPESIRERECFLCAENLPPEQLGIPYRSDYIILCNPFPIFPEHFTVPHVRHIPQQITNGIFMTMLDLSKDLGRYYTVFYNGPRCGASAPDHLHFQAGNKSFMIIEDEIRDAERTHGKSILRSDRLAVTAVDDKLRRYIVIRSTDMNAIGEVFNEFFEAHFSLTNDSEEPMMNILSVYDIEENAWQVCIFPREKHRPSMYFAEGEENMLLSPGAVDFGGVIITPRENDFEKIESNHVADMFREVSLEREKFGELIRLLKRSPS